MSVIEAVKQIDSYLNKSPFFKNRVLKKYVFFDKEDNAYYGMLKKMSLLKQIDNGYFDNENVYEILIYPFDFVKKNMQKEFIASAQICVSSKNSMDDDIKDNEIYLAKIWLRSSEYKHKGIGSNLLKMIDLFAVNNNKDLVVGYFAPFAFMTNDKKSVKKFYQKSNYKVLTGRNSALEKYSYDLIKKIMGVKTTKLASINFPTKKHDFTIIVPKQKIIYSSYSGMSKDKD